jgi:hypothetical protein
MFSVLVLSAGTEGQVAADISATISLYRKKGYILGASLARCTCTECTKHNVDDALRSEHISSTYGSRATGCKETSLRNHDYPKSGPRVPDQFTERHTGDRHQAPCIQWDLQVQHSTKTIYHSTVDDGDRRVEIAPYFCACALEVECGRAGCGVNIDLETDLPAVNINTCSVLKTEQND